MKNILLLTTGGTITSKGGEGRLLRIVNERLMSHETEPQDRIRLREILNFESSDLGPDEWPKIAESIAQGCSEADGIVATHGTDTLAWTAAMMSYMLIHVPIPVVLTGAQLPLSDPLSDGEDNLRTALAMAASGVPGVFVAFNRKIMPGPRVVKMHTLHYDAFDSAGKVSGTIDAGGLRLNPSMLPPAGGPFAPDTRLYGRVMLLKLFPGLAPDIFDAIQSAGCRGLVVEAFGAGGIPGHLLKPITTLAQSGFPVVICSQCLYGGGELTRYPYGWSLLFEGMIQGYDMTSEAAVTKLMWALGQTGDLKQIQSLFLTDLAGEVTLP